MKNLPKVGVGLLLLKGNKILLGKRKNAHGAGEYGGPGGHLELQEEFKDCVLRELAEELGPDIKIKNIRFLCLTNLRMYVPKHYVDIGMLADWVSGEAKVMEPDKVRSWEWYDIESLPSPLFGVVPNYVEAYKTGKVLFED